MKASELKTITMGEFIYGKGYMGLFTEGLGNGDVVGIRNSGYIVEFEIKVDKQDLRNEIKAIRCAIANDMRGCYSNTKFYKHEVYLDVKGRYLNELTGYKPNLFYFVVPIEFELIAVDGVNGTPYGVYCHGNQEYTLHFASGDQQRTANGFKESVKAKPIHKDKITYEQMKSVVRKATTELYETRKKILKV